MQPVVVQKLMGHTDIQVTLNTYTSVFDEFKERKVEKVNQYFLKGRMLDKELLDESLDEDDEMNKDA